jgi:hypothetical protein
MDFTKQNELFETLLNFVDDVKDKVKDSEYLEAMNTLKSLKLNLEGQQYSQFTAFNILSIEADMLSGNSKANFGTFLKKYKDVDILQSAFKDVEIYMKAIGKPFSQIAVMLMQST